MKEFAVHSVRKLILVLALAGLLAGTGMVRAETVHLSDGTTLSGELVSMDDKGFIVKTPDGNYSDRVLWGKLSQADLRELQQNPKAAPFVEPFIELTQEDKIKMTEIDVKDVPHLPHITNQSLFGGLATSPIGIFILLVLYAGNLYAAYEISIFRARGAGLVCGVSAVAPVIGPIIFLSMQPPQLSAQHAPEEWQPPVEEYADSGVAAAIAAEQAPAAEAAAMAAAATAQPAAPALPPTKTFARGQFTFNRRFFETQAPGFFGVARSGADKDMVLSVRSARGSYIAQRIPNITAAEISLQVTTGNASEEVVIPFVEIQEVQIKHKDA